MAFERLKKCVTTATISAYADFTKPVRLCRDASNKELGAVLSQLQDGEKRVIAYESRTLWRAELDDHN